MARSSVKQGNQPEAEYTCHIVQLSGSTPPGERVCRFLRTSRGPGDPADDDGYKAMLDKTRQLRQ